MKSLSALLLTLVFLLNIGGSVFVYVNFLINQDYIAENLCENKDKPVLQCNGKCHLAKELAKEEKKEKKDHKQKFEDRTVYFFCSIEEMTELSPVFFEKREHTNAQVQSRRAGFSTEVFHPPTIS